MLKQKLIAAVATLTFVMATAVTPVVHAGLAKEEALKGPAADFTLKNRAGGNLRLADLRGTAVMINFWASWCGPCRQELPILNNLYKQYKDMGFVILGVNIDNDPALADKLLKDIKLDFPVLLDPENKIAESYKVDTMPSSVFIDRNGNARMLHRGYEPGREKQYEDMIRKLVRE